MIWYVIFGFFAAVGVLFLLWLIAGAFLPDCKQCRVLVSCRPDDTRKVIRRFRWLRDLGLVRCNLVLLNIDLPETVQADMILHYPFVEFTDTQKQRGSEPHDGTEP